MPKAPSEKAVVLLRWVLGAHLVFGSLIVYAVCQRDKVETDVAKQLSVQRQINRLFMDPNAPAISRMDRARVAKAIFPEMSDVEITRLVGAK